VILILQGCASDNEKFPNPGRGDLGGPSLLIYDTSPAHLTSMVKPDTTIRFSATGSSLELSEMNKRMTSATTVTTWPGGKPVAGTWSANGLELTPSAPLGDGDYLVRVKPDGLKLAVTREHTLFHVGSLPRVTWISVNGTTPCTPKTTSCDGISIQMSEPVDASKWTLTVETQQNSTFKATGATLKDAGNIGGSFKLASPIDTSMPLRITLGMDVGATSGVKLDGKYTGQASSGPFSATFVPKDHVAPSDWLCYVPEITF